jgi:hypothetical protein
MTFQIRPETLVKIKSSQLESIQTTFIKTGYSLDEILEYDNGTIYECWSNQESEKSITLDITSDDTPSMDRVVTEIIDCWLELRAIRNLLTAEDDQPMLPETNPPSAHERLMAQAREWEADSDAEKEVLELVFGKNLDLPLLSFLTLDENDREALLQ